MAAQRAQQNNERTIALTILGVGTVASLATMFGSVWVVRAGVVLAILMAFAATYVTYRQLELERIANRREIAQEIELRSKMAEAHRADSVAMIDRFAARTSNLQEQIETARRQLASARSEISSLRGNAAWLRGELAERQARIDELTKRIEELETALREAEEQEQEESSNVLTLRPAATVTAEELWGEEHPTVMDLASLQLDVALDNRKQA